MVILVIYLRAWFSRFSQLALVVASLDWKLLSLQSRYTPYLYVLILKG